MTLIFKLYFRVSSRCGIKSYVTERQTDIFHLDYLTMLTLNIFKITMVILHYPEKKLHLLSNCLSKLVFIVCFDFNCIEQQTYLVMYTCEHSQDKTYIFVLV